LSNKNAVIGRAYIQNMCIVGKYKINLYDQMKFIFTYKVQILAISDFTTFFFNLELCPCSQSSIFPD